MRVNILFPGFVSSDGNCLEYGFSFERGGGILMVTGHRQCSYFGLAPSLYGSWALVSLYENPGSDVMISLVGDTGGALVPVGLTDRSISAALAFNSYHISSLALSLFRCSSPIADAWSAGAHDRPTRYPEEVFLRTGHLGDTVWDRTRVK